MTDPSTSLAAEIARIRAIRLIADREVDEFLKKYAVPRDEARAWLNWSKTQ